MRPFHPLLRVSIRPIRLTRPMPDCSRAALGSCRGFTALSRCLYPTQPPGAGAGGKRGTLGSTVVEHAKQDESKLSGVPEESVSAHKPLASISTPDLFSLTGQTVIVTGGGRGLGLTIVTAILQSGASVAAVDLLPEPSSEEWTRAKSIAQERSLDLTYTSLDVTNQSTVQSTFRHIFDNAKADSPVLGLFCAAGIQLMKPALQFSSDEFRKIIDVNLTGSFLCAQAFAKEFTTRHPVNPSDEGKRVNDPPAAGRPGADPNTGLAVRGGGSIVFTGSMSGHIANYGLEAAAYNASKAGVNQLTKNLAMEWGKKGIRVNSISPGYIRTAMTAGLLQQQPEFNDIWLKGSLLGRLSTPDEFRGPVIFLLSDASSFMTGADVLIDGGHTAT